MSLNKKQSKLETGSNGSWFLTEEHEAMLVQRVMTPFEFCERRSEKQRRISGTANTRVFSHQTPVESTDNQAAVSALEKLPQ